ncbi:SUKH-4 family immunity protein [Streptomyces sp. NPDC005953]|uniref:SUKH-4 family immunity protein n=1 Tax=Streptomyces sp. NPDC005953 TaxID=3156719 RepID=UPI00340C3D40
MDGDGVVEMAFAGDGALKAGGGHSAVSIRPGMFLSRVDATNCQQDPDHLGERRTQQQRHCSPESKQWLFIGNVIGYFLDSLIACDPTTDIIYAFPEGIDRYLPIHRDAESLVYSLCALQEFHTERHTTEDEDALALQTRSKIADFDDLPFHDPASECGIILEEIAEGAW